MYKFCVRLVYNFKGKKVIIMGLGLQGGGVGAARFMAKRGARVLVTDLKSRKELKPSVEKLAGYDNIEFVLGGHREEDFRQADFVIKNPAVCWDSRFLNIAKKAGAKIETAVGIFFELCPCQCIGITGTKGKSTVASLIYHILEEARRNVFLAGNMPGSQTLDILDKLTKDAMVVVELSSWQLEGLARHHISPHIGVVTNIFADHLNKYKNLNQYIKAKENITRFQTAQDVLILNYESKPLHSFIKKAKGHVLLYGKEKKPISSIRDRLQIKKEKDIEWRAYCNMDHIIANSIRISFSNLPFSGSHNVSNILGALSCVLLFEIDPEVIKKAILSFKGLQGRLQLIAKKENISFYNDTTATNPTASICAIETLRPRADFLTLICGGKDKGLDYKELASKIEDKVDCLVLLEGSATEKLKRDLSSRFVEKSLAGEVTSIKNAVTLGVKGTPKAGAGHSVLVLSPGAASFNLFKNEFDRGQAFVKAVEEL